MPEWAKDAPAAILVIVVVLAFLKHLVGERKDRREQSNRCHAAHAERQASMETVVKENSAIVKENSGVIGGVTEVLRRMNGQPKP